MPIQKYLTTEQELDMSPKRFLLIILALSWGYSTEIAEEKKGAYGWVKNG